MPKATYLSTASTHSVISGVGSVYGISLTPANGGTVILADLLDAGAAALDLNDPTNISGIRATFGPFTADEAPIMLPTHGFGVTAGLTVSFTSTPHMTVYHDP